MTSTFYFDSNFQSATRSNQYRLLELDDADRIGSNRLVVKSVGAAGAVLCSETATYAVKRVETSNTLLLARGSTVLASCDAYYECVRVRASLQRLAQLLADAGAAGVSLAALRRLVPASDAEIDAGLVALRAVPLQEQQQQQQQQPELQQQQPKLQNQQSGARWALLPAPHVARLLQMALAERQLRPDATRDDLVDAVARLEPQRATVDALLRLYVSDAGHFHLDAAALVFARALLDRRPKWRLRDFFAEWRALLPDAHHDAAHLEQLLLGLAIVDDDDDADHDDDGDDHSTVALFDRDALSLDAPTRLTQMFARRARWPVAHVEPYLAELLTPPQLAKLLQRATRTVTLNDRKYFVAK